MGQRLSIKGVEIKQMGHIVANTVALSRTCQVKGGRKEIVESKLLLRPGSCSYLARPPDHQGRPVPTFVEGTFISFEWA